MDSRLAATVGSWARFPAELKYSVVDMLAEDVQDVWSLAQTSKESYAICVPTLFRDVQLYSAGALFDFLDHVPASYGRHTRTLTVCTAPDISTCPATTNGPITEALAGLLGRSPLLAHLDLKLANSLRPNIIPCFEKLMALQVLAISNCGDENMNPLSERLVVSIAATVPSLCRLTLDRIARSALHAPELLGHRSSVPVCTGDNDIPPHGLLGTDLSLPMLLRLPTLRYLRIRDTHLGDTAWSTTPIQSPIKVLDLGSCYFETPDFNRVCTERIIGKVGDTMDEFSVSTPLSTDTFDFARFVSTPLKKLRKVHLTPLVPVEDVVDTLTTLSGSPVEELSVSCHEADMEDMCEALKDFLALRVKRPEELYPRLTEISLKTVGDDLESVTASLIFPVTSDTPTQKHNDVTLAPVSEKDKYDLCDNAALYSLVVG